MIVIGILAIPFVFYFNKTDFSAKQRESSSRLYGHDIPAVEMDRGKRLFGLAQNLGMNALVQALAGNAQTENEAANGFATNRLILEHEADAMGIKPTGPEIASAVSDLRAFHDDKGAFDISRYNDAVKNFLGPRGFTEAQIEDLAGDQVRLARIKQILALGLAMPEKESAENFDKYFSRLQVSVARVKTADLEKEVKLTDDDISKFYEAHKDQLKSDEKRKVQFVALILSEQQKKLPGKERLDALQKLSDEANDLHDAVTAKGADFAAVAAAQKVSITNTGDFTQAAPDPLLKAQPLLTEAAFQLTREEPNSDALQAQDGFYLLHLANVTPAEPLTLEQAKPKIVDALKAQRARETLGLKAATTIATLRDDLKKGTPLTEAAKKGNLKFESVPPFAIAEDIDREPGTPPPSAKAPDLPQIKRAVEELKPGEVSSPVPTADGALIVVLEKREAPDPAKAAENRRTLDERVMEGKETNAFFDWLMDRRKAAGVTEPQPS